MRCALEIVDALNPLAVAGITPVFHHAAKAVNAPLVMTAAPAPPRPDVLIRMPRQRLARFAFAAAAGVLGVVFHSRLDELNSAWIAHIASSASASRRIVATSAAASVAMMFTSRPYRCSGCRRFVIRLRSYHFHFALAAFGITPGGYAGTGPGSPRSGPPERQTAPSGKMAPTTLTTDGSPWRRAGV